MDIKNTNNKKYWGACRQRGILYTADGTENNITTLEISEKIYQKIITHKIQLLLDICSKDLTFYVRDNRAHCYFIQNS